MKKSIKYNLRTFVVLVLVVSFVCINAVALAGCDNKNNEKEFDNTYVPPVYNTAGTDKQAIIILPGMFASNLINAETNEPLWSGGALMNNLFITNFRLTKFDITNYFKKFLYKDENGKSVVPIRAANMNDQYLQYGLIDQYRNIYKFFNSKFNDKDMEESKRYEVVVYQYDWTKSAKESASDLTKFIEANHYKNNILVGHSLGGIVCDYYLAESEANRNNTKGFISLGTPHFGALDALMVAFGDIDIDFTKTDELIALLKLAGIDLGSGSMEDMNEVIGSLMDSFDGLNLMDKIPVEFVPEIEEGAEITPLETAQALMPFMQYLVTNILSYVRTMPSLYELLPSQELFENNVKIDGTVVTYDSFLETAKNLPAVKDTPQILNLVNNIKTNRESLYLNGKFIADAFTKNNVCKTVYVAGNGKSKTKTTEQINFITKPNDNKLYVKPNVDNIKMANSFREVTVSAEGYDFKEYIPQYKGDGLVLIKSAIANNSRSAINVICLEDYFAHQDLHVPVSASTDVDMIALMVPNELGKKIIKTINNYIEVYV